MSNRRAIFDSYLIADYSGARSVREQRKHLVVATAWPNHSIALQHLTREGLFQAVTEALMAAEQHGQRLMLGFDFSFSFPFGFFEAAFGSDCTDWGKSIGALYAALGASDVSDPRRWAAACNTRLAERFDLACGPFWGAGFAPQPHKPAFPFAKAGFAERRWVERQPSMHTSKSIFQLGGIGAVGLQSLYGISFLARLRGWALQANIPLFFWPQDGPYPPKEGPLCVEAYPRLYNHGIKSDESDAWACLSWTKSEDEVGALAEWLYFDKKVWQAWGMAREGWVLGVSPKLLEKTPSAGSEYKPALSEQKKTEEAVIDEAGESW
ncbi:MAG: hypothetical protein IMW91_09455 [Firmicutes bacterium]|nr:hypothetical protein [Bacillota bacterium]